MFRYWAESVLRTPPRRRGRADPLIALINVVFLLLIFLMVAGTVAPGLSREVTLIDTTNPSARPPPDAAVILEDGRLLFGGAEITAGAYAADRLAAGISEIRIVPDRELPAHQLVEIVSALQAAGATGVRIVTERSTP